MRYAASGRLTRGSTGRDVAAWAALALTVDRIRRRADHVPCAITVDRGYGQPATERDLHALGVRTVIPAPGHHLGARKGTEHGRGLRKPVK